MTENLKNRLYAIGDVDTGVLLVTLDPLRVSYISKDEIAAYGAHTRQSSQSVFDSIANKVSILFQHYPSSGPDFCYVADTAPGTWQANRIPFPPLFDALDFLAGRPDQGHPLPMGCRDSSPDGLHAAWLVEYQTGEHLCRQY